MRPPSRFAHRAWAIVLVALIALSLGASTASAQSDCTPTTKQLQRGERQVTFYLRATSTTDGPFLTTDVNASTAATFTPPGQAGPGLFMGALTGAEPGAVEFVFPPGVPSPLYLNLSRKVGMALVLKPDLPVAPPVGVLVSPAPTVVRAEIYVGQTLVGGQESIAHMTSSVGSTIGLCFRPETALVPAGQPITLRVFFDGGILSPQFVTGTGASKFTFTYFDEDPLATLVYVQKGKLILSDADVPTEPDPTERTSSESRARTGSAVLLPLFTPLTLRTGRGRMALLAALVVAAVSQAGCITSPAGPADESESSPSASKETPQISYSPLPPAQQQNGTGAVDGTVVDGTVDGIRAVSGALVVLAGSKQSAKTDAGGGFRFSGIYPGTFTLHIEAAGFQTEEIDVAIVADNLTRVKVTLYPPGYDPTSANKIHKHPIWPPDGKITVYSDSFLPEASSNIYYPFPARVGETWVCTSLNEPNTAGGCLFQIPDTQKNPVPPGTGRLEVVLSWSGSQAPKRFGLGFYSPTTGALPPLLPRASGQPFQIPIFPNEADPGHQNYSRWAFTVHAPLVLKSQPHSPFVYAGGEMTVRIVAYKGVVPFEPPHPDFWKENHTYVVVDNRGWNSYTGSCNLLSSTYLGYCGDQPGGVTWTPTFIPPGTSEIRGWLAWQHSALGPTSVPTSWGVAYKPNPAIGWKVAEMDVANARTENNARIVPFLIRPAPEETDQYYHTTTNWVFSLEDYSDHGVNSSPGIVTTKTTWTLNATVVRDPNYVDQ